MNYQDLINIAAGTVIAIGGEWTISDTLERIVSEHKHPRRLLAAAIAQEINSVSPTGKHIKTMT